VPSHPAGPRARPAVGRLRQLLLTSAGSGVGRAVRAAAALSPHDYRITGTGIGPVDGTDLAAYRVPPTGRPADFQQAVLRLAAGLGGALVLPGRDDDAEVLAEIEPALRAVGAVYPIGPPAAVAAAIDKARTGQLLGPDVDFVATATGVVDALALAARVGWPLLLKPRCGSASRGVRQVDGERTLRTELTDSDVAQQYLPPNAADARHWDGLWPGGQDGEYSIQLALGPAGQLLGSFASRNTLFEGRPVVVETVPDATVADLVSRAAGALAAAGASGLWNLEGRRGADGRIRLYEVNSRPTGITGLRACLGFNEVDLLYGAFMLGRPVAAPPITTIQVVDATAWTTPARTAKS
jgi:carbamoyl-phosphate synthase large subunit